MYLTKHVHGLLAMHKHQSSTVSVHRFSMSRISSNLYKGPWATTVRVQHDPKPSTRLDTPQELEAGKHNITSTTCAIQSTMHPPRFKPPVHFKDNTVWYCQQITNNTMKQFCLWSIGMRLRAWALLNSISFVNWGLLQMQNMWCQNTVPLTPSMTIVIFI